MSTILGVNAVFHDPAAALVVDGKVVAAAEGDAALIGLLDEETLGGHAGPGIGMFERFDEVVVAGESGFGELLRFFVLNAPDAAETEPGASEARRGASPAWCHERPDGIARRLRRKAQGELPAQVAAQAT